MRFFWEIPACWSPTEGECKNCTHRPLFQRAGTWATRFVSNWEACLSGQSSGSRKKGLLPRKTADMFQSAACAMPRRWEPAKSCLSLVMTELGDLGGQSTQPSRAKQSRGLPLAVDAKLRAPDRCESSPPGNAGAPEYGRGGAWRWHPLVKKRKRGVVTPG